jgi:hypothetical protein
MLFKNNSSRRTFALGLVFVLGLTTAACNKPPATEGFKRIPKNQETAGFLKDYSKLTPNSDLDGAVKTFVSTDAEKRLHNYIAVIVDPVEVYLASDADQARIPEQSRAAAANYFRAALTRSVSDAFAPVDQPGPLVLRLRAALIGFDAGGNGAGAGNANISKVGVEIELLDSITGEQIAAAIDREPLGDGAEIAAGDVARHEKSAAAREAFDEWARRLRRFLNHAHELRGEDAKRADESYQPFGSSPGTK